MAVVYGVLGFVLTSVVLLAYEYVKLRLSVSSLKTEVEHWKSLAEKDNLTALPTRNWFERKLGKVLEQLPTSNQTFMFGDKNRRFDSEISGLGIELLFIDIDHFKSINDNYGHNIGDDTLKKVAHAILSIIRDNDLVCRWGGEEILIALGGIKEKDVGVIADKILTEIRKIKITDEKTVTASIGVAYTQYNCSQSELIKIADQAMYQAKKTGRNQVVIAGNFIGNI